MLGCGIGWRCLMGRLVHCSAAFNTVHAVTSLLVHSVSEVGSAPTLAGSDNTMRTSEPTDSKGHVL